MGFFKLIAILGVVAAVMQPTYSAAIGNACLCTLEYIPLCGSDGQTYSNDCEFKCAKNLNRNLEVFAKGECISVSNLPAIEDPVEVHNLPANDEADTCICPFLILAPVCGSDGQTYVNKCEFNCAKKLNRNLEVFKNGECIEISHLPAQEENDNCICTMEYDPLCGSDGQTYGNKCGFDCAKKLNRNLEIFKKGECIQIQNLPAIKNIAEVQNLPANEEVDTCVCPFIILDPICGSDGQTYSNDCEFNCAKKLNRNLEVFAKGECNAVSNLPVQEENNVCICTLEYNPLCGSDGQTYANKCEFNCAKKLNRNLEIFKKGECMQISNLPAHEYVPICTLEYNPLCGSDGHTYANECIFNYNKKINRNLELFARGECVKVEPF